MQMKPKFVFLLFKKGEKNKTIIIITKIQIEIYFQILFYLKISNVAVASRKFSHTKGMPKASSSLKQCVLNFFLAKFDKRKTFLLLIEEIATEIIESSRTSEAGHYCT